MKLKTLAGIATLAVFTATSTFALESIIKGAKVVEVIDGDTVKVSYSGNTETIRMIGIDAPEKSTTRFGYAECFGNEATEHLKKLLSKGIVDLKFDKTQGTKDKYGRTLAYLFVGAANINGKMVRDGFAWEYTYDTKYKFQKAFKTFQKLADKKNLGLWGPKACDGIRSEQGKSSSSSSSSVSSTSSVESRYYHDGKRMYIKSPQTGCATLDSNKKLMKVDDSFCDEKYFFGVGRSDDEKIELTDDKFRMYSNNGEEYMDYDNGPCMSIKKDGWVVLKSFCDPKYFVTTYDRWKAGDRTPIAFPGTSSSSSSSTESRNYYTGPEGGCYYYNSNFNKTYVERSFCSPNHTLYLRRGGSDYMLVENNCYYLDNQGSRVSMGIESCKIDEYTVTSSKLIIGDLKKVNIFQTKVYEVAGDIYYGTPSNGCYMDMGENKELKLVSDTWCNDVFYVSTLDKYTGTISSSSSSSRSYRTYFTGPKGGCYYYNSNGNKTYVDHSFCGR